MALFSHWPNLLLFLRKYFFVSQCRRRMHRQPFSSAEEAVEDHLIHVLDIQTSDRKCFENWVERRHRTPAVLFKFTRHVYRSGLFNPNHYFQ